MTNKFSVLGLLGQGTFGNVLEIENCHSKERLAMKVIRPQHEFHNHGEQELEMLKILQKSFPEEPTLLQYKRAFYSNSTTHGKVQRHLCLIFPKFEMSLTHLLRGGKIRGFTMTSASHIGHQICHALSCLWQLGIIHRDIKPDNIMVRKPPVDEMIDVCLIDFGSATTKVEPSTKPYVQSRFYRAPEVMLGHKYSLDVDMWSFGCVLVELLFAKPLYLGQNEVQQLALINHFQGPFPQYMIEFGTSILCEHFKSGRKIYVNGETYYDMAVPPGEQIENHYWKTNDTLEKVCLNEKLCRQEDYSDTQARKDFFDFVQGCLQIDYADRLKPEQALGHPFLRYYENKGILQNQIGHSQDHPRQTFTAQSQQYSGIYCPPSPRYQSPSNSYSKSSLTDLDSVINNWDTSSAMDSMFRRATSFNSELSSWDHSYSKRNYLHRSLSLGSTWEVQTSRYPWNDPSTQHDLHTRRRTFSCQYQNRRHWDHDVSSKLFNTRPRYHQDWTTSGGY